MSKKRNRHTEEFKREAVRLMLSRGERAVGDVARSIGVTEGDLHRWREKRGDAVRVTAAIPETVCASPARVAVPLDAAQAEWHVEGERLVE